MPPDPAPGVLFGPYRLEEQLGSGGFGEVWRATEVASGRTVALKILVGRFGSAAADRLRADVELLAAAAVGHDPHVVAVRGGGLEPAPHLVMEYVPGESLAARLARVGHLSVAETMAVGQAVAAALVALSRAGIVHRDVKAANVLLAASGEIKLTDFGIAKIVGFDSLTAAGQLPMSLHYAAPEVWEGKGGEPADRYALGVLLYECLVGHPPFTGGYAEVYRGHREAAPNLAALPPDVALDLRSLIGECLAKDPADRPPDHAALLARLDAIAGSLEADEPGIPPMTLGPWRISGPHPTQAWAFRAHHEQSGAPATVEVVFGDLAVGEALRGAVAANPALVPLGAERLLAANRLILRPGEAWPAGSDPGGPFAFWVAREELPVPPPALLHEPELRSALLAITALRAAADAAGIALDMGPDRLVVLPDGGIYVRRPGLPPGPTQPADVTALETLRALPLPAALLAIVAGAPDLAALAERLDRAPDPIAATVLVPEPTVVLTATELPGRTVAAEADTTRAAPAALALPGKPGPPRRPDRRLLAALLVGVLVIAGSGLLLASGLLSGQGGGQAGLAGPSASATAGASGISGPTATAAALAVLASPSPAATGAAAQTPGVSQSPMATAKPTPRPTPKPTPPPTPRPTPKPTPKPPAFSVEWLAPSFESSVGMDTVFKVRADGVSLDRRSGAAVAFNAWWPSLGSVTTNFVGLTCTVLQQGDLYSCQSTYALQDGNGNMPNGPIQVWVDAFAGGAWHRAASGDRGFRYVPPSIPPIYDVTIMVPGGYSGSMLLPWAYRITGAGFNPSTLPRGATVVFEDRTAGWLRIQGNPCGEIGIQSTDSLIVNGVESGCTGPPSVGDQILVKMWTERGVGPAIWTGTAHMAP